MASRSTATGEAGQPVPMTLSAKVRAWRRIAMVALILVVHLPFHGLWRLFGARSPFPRSFLRWTAYAAGIDVRFTGTPLARNVLLVANHITWFDIPVIAGVTGARFVSKGEVEHWPLVGWMAKMNRTIFIARAERGQVARQAEELSDAIADGQPVTLFPEGGTGDGVSLRPFRAALFSALYVGQHGARVQPFAVDYVGERKLIAWTDKRDGFGPELYRLMGLRGRRKVVLTFLPPLDPKDFRDRKALAAATETMIAETLGLRAPKPV